MFQHCLHALHEDDAFLMSSESSSVPIEQDDMPANALLELHLANGGLHDLQLPHRQCLPSNRPCRLGTVRFIRMALRCRQIGVLADQDTDRQPEVRHAYASARGTPCSCRWGRRGSRHPPRSPRGDRGDCDIASRERTGLGPPKLGTGEFSRRVCARAEGSKGHPGGSTCRRAAPGRVRDRSPADTGAA